MAMLNDVDHSYRTFKKEHVFASLSEFKQIL